MRISPLFLLVPALALTAAEPYRATTESLRSHKAPQWYEDAKFGIFVHWGPYAVPAYHEWYLQFISPKSGFGFLRTVPFRLVGIVLMRRNPKPDSGKSALANSPRSAKVR